MATTENDKVKSSRDHYYGNYDKLNSFISYYYQIYLFRELNRNKILEIGIGNKTVSRYLQQNGYNVTTCDYNEHLEPDYVADIRQLPFDDNSFDVVLACEVLEHLPWSDVPQALSELHRVAGDYCIISVPTVRLFVEFVMKFPMILQIFKRTWFDIFLTVPLPIFTKCSKHHHWEMGMKGYSFGKIRKTLRQRFRILKEARPVLNPRHHFFVLEKV
ncbi:MAG: class I SAM-dependent methyltransferase [Planctomycetes bacterium]|nr:class I SAM-dependent methyltransferase [Planctomycetota bacterium]